MRKIKIIFMMVLAVFVSVGTVQDVYADDIPVTFRIRNHEAEIWAENIANGMELKVGDKIPDTTITYKNATRAVVNVVRSGAVIKSENFPLTLSNEEQSFVVDLSDISLEAGAWTIEVYGFNADDTEARADNITFNVTERETPSVPNTGSMEKFEKEGNHLETIVPIMAILVAIAFWSVKRVRKEIRR